MIPEFMRPDGYMLFSALVIALILDIIYPEHRGLLLAIHPVHTSYLLALKLGRPYSSRLRGVTTWVIVTLVHVTPFTIALALAYELHPIAWVIIASITLKFSMSLKLLLDICYNVYRSLNTSLDEARRWTQMIVRRDTSKLDKPRVISATIESLAESLVDGFTSPLLYYALLGPLGALVQRIANTLDGALGYKTPEYANVGWFSARMDTVINYIPARITAILIAILAPVASGNVIEALRVWWRWRRATESVNAGHPMSAMAGALRVKLEKPGNYVLNDKARYPEPNDIMRGMRVAVVVSIAYTIIISIILLVTP